MSRSKDSVQSVPVKQKVSIARLKSLQSEKNSGELATQTTSSSGDSSSLPTYWDIDMPITGTLSCLSNMRLCSYM